MVTAMNHSQKVSKDTRDTHSFTRAGAKANACKRTSRFSARRLARSHTHLKSTFDSQTKAFMCSLSLGTSHTHAHTHTYLKASLSSLTTAFSSSLALETSPKSDTPPLPPMKRSRSVNVPDSDSDGALSLSISRRSCRRSRSEEGLSNVATSSPPIDWVCRTTEPQSLYQTVMCALGPKRHTQVHNEEDTHGLYA